MYLTIQYRFCHLFPACKYFLSALEDNASSLSCKKGTGQKEYFTNDIRVFDYFLLTLSSNVLVQNYPQMNVWSSYYRVNFLAIPTTNHTFAFDEFSARVHLWSQNYEKLESHDSFWSWFPQAELSNECEVGGTQFSQPPTIQPHPDQLPKPPETLGQSRGGRKFSTSKSEHRNRDQKLRRQVFRGFGNWSL